jgi:hypothetical protein
MFTPFGWDVGFSIPATFLLVVGAIVIGVFAQVIGEVRLRVHWIVVGFAALIGGWLGSESLGSLSTWGPVFEGLYVLPAIIGGLVIGVVVDFLLRWQTQSSYVHHPRPI